MGEAKQIEIEARGYGVEIEEDRPPDEPWPSDAELLSDELIP